jgi:hypothetical protein
MIPETDLYAAAFFLADHAAVENGKIYLNGGFWNQMQFPSFPASSTFSVVGVINVPWSAHHQLHKFAVIFTDADGHKFDGEFGGEFQITPNPGIEIGQPFLMPIAAAANGFVFPAPGHYSAQLLVDDEEIARWGFRVSSTEQPVGGADGPRPGTGPGDIPRF